MLFEGFSNATPPLRGPLARNKDSLHGIVDELVHGEQVKVVGSGDGEHERVQVVCEYGKSQAVITALLDLLKDRDQEIL